jgi:hypothetical protein
MVTMLNTHPVLANIADDDPEVLKALAGIRTPVVGMSAIIADGPHGRATVYEHIAANLLPTFVSRGRRYVFAVDYARYLVALSHIGRAQGRRHHLTKPENRPAHDPKSQRAAYPMVGKQHPEASNTSPLVRKNSDDAPAKEATNG